ncbi:MAG: DUF1440 domain-containing protein [Candidatus Dormibacteraeota bacterium]|nr:DUF1440 domain-containing protein [Candidatus Dormibacteraeota bacterium]
MTDRRLSLAGAVVGGAVAAAVGTAAMDALLYWRYRREGGQVDPISWEIASGLNDWDKAPVPAKVGKRLAEAFLQRELSASYAQLMTNVMHWGYGVSWGAAYGLVAESGRSRSPLWGLPFGAGVWAGDYVVLPLGKFYKPIWEYDARTLWKDLSAHLVFGLATATSFALLRRRQPRTDS